MPRRPDLPQPGVYEAGRPVIAEIRSVTGRQPTEDQPVLADSQAPRSRKDLLDRLTWLPAWHPSSLAPDAAARSASIDRPPSVDGLRACPERRTDGEHADRVQHIRTQLADARARGLATDERFFNRSENRWTTDRQLLHRELVDELYSAADSVPCEGKAVMAGGLGGAGKSTVLEKHAGIDQSQWLTINPDDIKEAMARHGLIPELDGLSPMEASDLVHAESSYIAKRLARRAMDEGKNIIWDITMSSLKTTAERLDDLDRAGYTTTGIFVDVDVGEAVRRADARHRRGHENYQIGVGFGGRYVPPEVIEAQLDLVWGSCNRYTFEQVKPRFSVWAIYDNSVTGRNPVLIEASHGWKREEER